MGDQAAAGRVTAEATMTQAKPQKPVTQDARQSYLHIAYLPRSRGWLLPIIAAVQAAKSDQLRTSAKTWANSDLSELGLAVSTKLAILPLIIQQLQQHLSELDREVSQLQDLDKHIQKGAGFMPKDRDLPYRLLAAIDAFIYEFRSTYEIVGKFLLGFAANVLDSPLSEGQVKSILRQFGISDAWIADLADQRKLFFHNTAPWIALKISSRTPLRAELLVLKRKVHDLDGSPEVIEFHRLEAIHNGLIDAMAKLQDWLISQVQEKDAAT